MFARIGPMELMLILAVALIVVGPAKLPEVGSALGKTIRGFRESMKDIEKSFDDKPATSQASRASQAPQAQAPDTAAAENQTGNDPKPQ